MRLATVTVLALTLLQVNLGPEAVKYVTGVWSLLAFLAVFAYWAYRARLGTDIQMVKEAGEADRPEVIAHVAAQRHVQVNLPDLRPEDRAAAVMEELRNRRAESAQRFWLLFTVVVLGTGMAVVWMWTQTRVSQREEAKRTVTEGQGEGKDETSPLPVPVATVNGIGTDGVVQARHGHRLELLARWTMPQRSEGPAIQRVHGAWRLEDRTSGKHRYVSDMPTRGAAKPGDADAYQTEMLVPKELNGTYLLVFQLGSPGLEATDSAAVPLIVSAQETASDGEK